MIKWPGLLMFFSSILYFGSCEEPVNTKTVKPAIVSFFNASSYRVDIHKKFNPEHFDQTTLVCSVAPGDTVQVQQYPSYDQVTGDTFYLHYKIRLQDHLDAGILNIFADTQHGLSNMRFVIESDKKYTKTIPQPNSGELIFFNGYIFVQNQGDTQIQLFRDNENLPRHDNKSYFISAFGKGYYEIPFRSETTIEMNLLIAFSSHDVSFPVFTMEKGKLYEFTVNEDRITGPVIRNIDTN